MRGMREKGLNVADVVYIPRRASLKRKECVRNARGTCTFLQDRTREKPSHLNMYIFRCIVESSV